MSYYGSEIDQRFSEIVRGWKRYARINFWLGFGIGQALMLVLVALTWWLA